MASKQEAVASTPPSGWYPRPMLVDDPAEFAQDFDALSRGIAGDGSVVLSLDLATLAGFAVAVTSRGTTGDPRVAFGAVGLLRLQHGRRDNGPGPPDRLFDLLNVLRPDLITVRRTRSEIESLSLDDPFDGLSLTGVLTEDLKSTVKAWTVLNLVPDQEFTLHELKSRFVGREAATMADLVAACNARLLTTLNPAGREKSRVNRVAVAALGLVAALSESTLRS